ncbi:DUF433 domain-containing protein [Halobaculum sp. MBLA0147]|uniref:DUF433 domain-containing protein n=1 Tax=Halobaculum sp. MBLA0147 TaxID=3079934 RepID=UPI0035253B94
MSTTVRIVKTADVLGGDPRLEGTRVGVFEVGSAVRDGGHPPEAVAEEFGIDIEQVAAALQYYDDHPELMDTLRTQRRARRLATEERADDE